MKIAFIWYWDQASQILDNWRDGHKAAIDLISKKHEVVWYLDKKLPAPEDDHDFLLYWCDSTSDCFSNLDSYKAKKGLCLTTDPCNLDNIAKFNVVFVESEPVLTACLPHAMRTIKAFGTDEKFYSPDKSVKKDIDFFYPATFSLWKKQSAIAHLGNKLLCVGTVQPDGEGELKACRDYGVNVEIGYYPAEKIREYYRRTRMMVIPAVHGSERTVLEAMSMNIVPEVTHPLNVRTRSYVEEYRRSGIKKPRDFILKNYSAEVFASQLLKGIEGR